MARAKSAWASEARRMLGYLLAGGVAAAANYGTRFLFSLWLPFEAAVVLAAAVGTATAFVLMRLYVFAPSRHSLRTQQGLFVLISIASGVQTLLISSLLLRVVWPELGVTRWAEASAHLVGVAFPALSSYVAHRWFTFR
jgi:putative flippase GtrA